MGIRIKCFWILFLFSSCSSSPWLVQNIAPTKEITNAKRIYTKQGYYPGLCLEFFYQENVITGFLNYTMCTLKPLKHTSTPSVILQYTINDQSYTTTAILYRGGQRLSLDEETTNRFFTALKEHNTINLEVDGLCSVIEPEDFHLKYQKAQKKKFFFDKLLPNIF